MTPSQVLTRTIIFSTTVDTKNLEKIVIFDIDGTLSDCRARTHYLDKEPKDWDNFFGKSHEDPPHSWAVNLAQILNNAGYQIHVVTGRPIRMMNDTAIWLKTHDIPFISLKMRPEGDRREDHLVKQDILHSHFKKEDVALVIDDRENVVNMWREEGLICLQAQPL